MRTAARALVGLLALVGALAAAAALGFALRGVSARPEPPTWEARLARAARHLLIPRAARRLPNPLPASAEVLESARAHWADHCSSCHGNDGRGDIAPGRNLYPRAPDMTVATTQDLSDGELFWIIENGVKLTGMPAWGSGFMEDAGASWELVHFIRHLPEITQEELSEMAHLNPTSRAELAEEMAKEAFLAGSGTTAGEVEHKH